MIYKKFQKILQKITFQHSNAFKKLSYICNSMYLKLLEYKNFELDSTASKKQIYTNNSKNKYYKNNIF